MASTPPLPPPPPPPPPTLPTSLASLPMDSPLQEYYLDNRAKAILDSQDFLPLTTFLYELYNSTSSIETVDANHLLDYIKENFLSSFCLCLVTLFESFNSAYQDVQDTAFDLLCRLFIEDNEHELLQETTIAAKEVKSSVLDWLKARSLKRFLPRILDFVIKIIPAEEVRCRIEWPEIIVFVDESLNANSEGMVEYALQLLYKLIPHYAVERLVNYDVDFFYETLMNVFDSEILSFEEKISAAKTSNCFFLYWTNTSNQDRYIGLLIHVVRTLSTLIELGLDEDVWLLVLELTKLAKKNPWSLIQQLDDVVESMFKILDEAKLMQERTRLRALEFVVILAEETDQGREMLLELPHIITKYVEKINSLLLADISDDPDRAAAEIDYKNECLTSVSSYGKVTLGRLANALGGEVLIQNLPESFLDHLRGKEWRRCHATVSSLAVISRSFLNVKESKQNSQLMEKMTEFFAKVVEGNIHPCVCWTALNIIEEFSKHSSPQFQEQNHHLVLPALTKAMDGSNIPRVQAQAASAVFYFIKNCNSKVLHPYLNLLVYKMLNHIQKGKHIMKDKALRALALIANSVEDQFEEFYCSVMPCVKTVMLTAKAESDHILLASSIECITTVWLAVRKLNISDDTELVVEVLIESLGYELDANNPMRIQVLEAWGRLCDYLGKEFKPYMSVAIPCLLKSVKLEYIIMPENPDILEESARAIILGDKKIWINTNVLEEKTTACMQLFYCAAILKEDLYLWIEEVAQTLVPLLDFELSEAIRRTAVAAMPELLKSARAAIQEGYLKKWPFTEFCLYVLTAMVKALSKEQLSEINARILKTLNECMKMFGHVLDREQTNIFLEEIMKIIKAGPSIPRSNAEIIDPLDQQKLQDEENERDEVYDKAGDCLAILIRNHSSYFIMIFEKLGPCIQLMWEKDKTAKELKFALRIFHDVMKQFRERAFGYYKNGLPDMFRGCKGDKPEYQQVVAQLIGISAEYAESEFMPFLRGAFSCLIYVIGHPKALEVEYVMAHDAAVSALGKILQFHRNKLNAAKVFGIWFCHLPLKNNLIEAKVVHHQLCSLVEKSDVQLLGPDKANFRRIVAVYAEIIWAGKKLATEETIRQMTKQLKHHRKRLLPVTWTSITSSLETHLQRMLESKLSS